MPPKDPEQDLLDYLAQQFPATIGHMPLAGLAAEIRKHATREARQKALLNASSEVAGHWNDRTTTTNQYEQAQRSAGVLQRMATEVA
jgi:hypothetical protein